MLKRKYIHKLLIAMAGILFGFSSCDEPFKDTVFRAAENVSAAEWVTANPDFSDWVAVLNKVNLLPAMNEGTRKSTFFIIKNDALNEYAQDLGYNSIFDLSDDQLKNLVKSHTIPSYAIQSKNMIGRVGQKTAAGTYITVATEGDRRYINNGPTKTRSYFEQPDIEVINGYVHVLDWPILTEHNTLWAEILDNENYSIFADLLRQTGWLDRFLDKEDSMVLIGPGATPYASAEEIASNLASENWTAYPYKDNKTVFVVPNSVFLAQGYEDADAFRMDIFPDQDPTDPTSTFYDFMRYHIINRTVSYEEIVDFPKNPAGAGYLKENYVFTMCESQSGIAVQDQDVAGIFLNPQQNPVQIDFSNRNIPGSNGFIHEIDGFMYVPTDLPHYAQEVELTNPIQFSGISFYRAEKEPGSKSDNFYFYSGNFPGITWTSVDPEGAKVWYANIFMPVSKTPEINRFKNFDGIFWDLGAAGTMFFDMPKLGDGKYDMWIENAVIPSVGGESQVFWGDNDGYPFYIKHAQQAKVEDNQEYIRAGTFFGLGQTYSVDRALRILYSVSIVGQGGVDRFLFTPRS